MFSMKNFEFTPSGVCSRKITFTLENGKIYNLAFEGGCSGNLRAISKLLEGVDATVAIDKLKGNKCGMRETSCADQLTKALEKALAE